MPKSARKSADKLQRPTVHDVTDTGYVKNSRVRLSDGDIESLSVAELRAIASDRGYVPVLESNSLSRGAIREAFRSAQDEDDTLEDGSIEENEEGEIVLPGDTVLERTATHEQPASGFPGTAGAVFGQEPAEALPPIGEQMEVGKGSKDGDHEARLEATRERVQKEVDAGQPGMSDLARAQQGENVTGRIGPQG